MSKGNTITVSVRLTPELKARAKKAAEAQGRNLSNFIARCVEKKTADVLATPAGYRAEPSKENE